MRGDGLQTELSMRNITQQLYMAPQQNMQYSQAQFSPMLPVTLVTEPCKLKDSLTSQPYLMTELISKYSDKPCGSRLSQDNLHSSATGIINLIIIIFLELIIELNGIEYLLYEKKLLTFEEAEQIYMNLVHELGSDSKKQMWGDEEVLLLQWVVFNYMLESGKPPSNFVGILIITLELLRLGKSRLNNSWQA